MSRSRSGTVKTKFELQRYLEGTKMDEKIVMVKVARIKVGKHEQRLDQDPVDTAVLVNSIGRIGLLSPLIVSSNEDGYDLVAGHSRLAAIKKLGYPEVQCIIRKSSVAVAAEITFAENFCRKSLSPIEQACAIKACYEDGSMSVQEMSKAFHKSENWIAAQMAMVEWPKDVLEAIHRELISVSAAHNLAMITDEAYRAFLLQTAVESGATARSTAAWLQGWRSSQPAETAVEAEPVGPGQPPQPVTPMMPCLCCSTVLRMDQMSHVPVCQGCIQTIRNIPDQT